MVRLPKWWRRREPLRRCPYCGTQRRIDEARFANHVRLERRLLGLRSDIAEMVEERIGWAERA